VACLVEENPWEGLGVDKALKGFLDEVRRVARLAFPRATLDYTIVRLTHFSLRITINEETFVDVYFNEETQRTDYALIHKGERVYGVDNLKGWHYHPFQVVEQHLPCPEPSVQAVFEKMRGIVEALGVG
jgi:hypothetical protein